MKIIALGCTLLLATRLFAAETTTLAATSINSFGLDLLRISVNPRLNTVLSPYSVVSALAMTYVGADGITHDEMARTLYFGTNETQVQESFSLLEKQLKSLMTRSSSQTAKDDQQHPERGMREPIRLLMANRLTGGSVYAFRASYRNCISNYYQTELVQGDYQRSPNLARKLANDWVLGQTGSRISDLIPEGDLGTNTMLVLVNALYFKAPWADPFAPTDTKQGAFHLASGAAVDVPMMWHRETVGYQKYNNFTAIAVPYNGDELQFLILLPSATNGLAALESGALPLGACANLPKREIILGLPKFKMALPTLQLNPILHALGMDSAFDRSANFSRMAEEKIFISGVYHKTVLSVDEKGTEAAASTAATAAGTGIPENVLTVTVDHPFLFAIQHRASGACLFLGHVADPRWSP